MLRVDLTGGAPASLGLEMPNLYTAHVDPGGKRVAFSAGKVVTEMWMAENILPAAK